MAALTEDDLIARYFAPVAMHPAAHGLKDDAASISTGELIGGELVMTMDMLVAGVHFFPDDPPSMIARKALRVNLSDLAAKGARPFGFLLGLGLPPDWSEAWLAAFAEALRKDSLAFDCPLFGGDTVKTPLTTISITALGRADNKAVLRTGASVGDVIAVTGTIGTAALGLRARTADRLSNAVTPEWLSGLYDDERDALISGYWLPEPRLLEGAVIAERASASMDVSDGLIGDARKMLKASGVGGSIDLRRVPMIDAVKRAITMEPSLLRQAMTGGDDYELLITCHRNDFVAMSKAIAARGGQLTAIGAVTKASSLTVLGPNGKPVDWVQGGYQHF